ncbi:peptidoglycan editing factor PgeF [Pseudorhodoferax sp. Leaf265]|jgi:YfiH family protein|uniref:peptidoglycan editing factor PgeF n=1 Tax=Pseudorhodoferax sp. Leaf265 TaxID=1736315 RepID=UPI0006FBE4CA|nr:peptidoglycan editing factor PgeF [Pseudorhodoferax sp. Leaf265]KQP03185.1 laccase [Pseudorhodoferax sp. Leaf265]PZP95390.1 MAG: peptidoglycan editing factor PgeF [Variovorax paradoxus]PZQ06161.1 MAG: peptidoglycan editing factor PgeF [Variovorax paradoxus]
MDLLLPDWPAPATVQARMSLRGGGVSAPPYASLNLGDHVGDEAAAVQRNRALLAERLGATPVFMQQVHGTAVACLPSPHAVPVADACMGLVPGLACTIMVADCLPVLFCDTQGRAVAAAHAGWRGLAAGVLENTVASLRRAVPQAQWLAWLGPCIGPTAFEVGDEVRATFVAQSAAAADCFRAHTAGKWLADLPALARLRLAALELHSIHGNDSSAPWCTVGDASRFFSHRRDRVSGRMAACIWLAG